VKRVRATPPATPEKTLKGLALLSEQRDMLIRGMSEIRAEVLSYEDLAKFSPNLKDRMRALDLTRTALTNLTKAFATPFRNDLIEVMDETKAPPRRIPRRAKKRRSVLFLELLPEVKAHIDAMDRASVQKRWNDGSDRRSVNLECLEYETDAVLDLVQKAGFALDKPDGQTLDLIRRIFSYTGGKTVGISMVRKRMAAWKTPGKQDIYAFHKN
jgi:hypothetical protein